jgi:hypothetical protein
MKSRSTVYPKKRSAIMPIGYTTRRYNRTLNKNRAIIKPNGFLILYNVKNFFQYIVSTIAPSRIRAVISANSNMKDEYAAAESNNNVNRDMKTYSAEYKHKNITHIARVTNKNKSASRHTRSIPIFRSLTDIVFEQ